MPYMSFKKQNKTELKKSTIGRSTLNLVKRCPTNYSNKPLIPPKYTSFLVQTNLYQHFIAESYFFLLL